MVVQPFVLLLGKSVCELRLVEAVVSPPHIESKISEQVFLAADRRTAAGFDQQVAGRHPDVGGDALGHGQLVRAWAAVRGRGDTATSGALVRTSSLRIAAWRTL